MKRSVLGSSPRLASTLSRNKLLPDTSAPGMSCSMLVISGKQVLKSIAFPSECPHIDLEFLIVEMLRRVPDLTYEPITLIKRKGHQLMFGIAMPSQLGQLIPALSSGSDFFRAQNNAMAVMVSTTKPVVRAFVMDLS